MKNHQKYGLIGCLLIACALGCGCALEATCDDNSEYADLGNDGKMICKKFDSGHCGKNGKGGYVNCKEEGFSNAADFLCVYDDTNLKYQCEIKKCHKGYIKGDDGYCSDCEKGYHHPDEAPNQCVLNNRLNKCGFSEIDCNKYIANGRAESVECQKKWEYGAISEFGCNMKSCKPGYHREYNELSEANECVPDSSIQCGEHSVNCTENAFWSRGNCIEGKCVPTECAIGWYLHNDACFQSDNENCGEMGKKCAPEKFCSNNECKDSCESPLKNCNGRCVDVNSDVYNCGTCDNNCNQNNNLNDPNIESVKCEATQCVIDKCQSGYHKYGSMCEIDSNENCGSHGNACETDDFSVCYSAAPLQPSFEPRIDENEEYYVDEGDSGSCYVKAGQICENGRCVSKNASIVLGTAEVEESSQINVPGQVPVEM